MEEKNLSDYLDDLEKIKEDIDSHGKSTSNGVYIYSRIINQKCKPILGRDR